MKLALISALALLSGCGLLPSNNRVYNYSITKGPNGIVTCTLSIDSGSVVSGVVLSACDGSLTASATTIQQGASAIDLPALISAVGSVTQNATLGKAIPAAPAQPVKP